jgi:hypothetical protein
MKPKFRYFTFAQNHVHPVTGESLARCYVKIPVPQYPRYWRQVPHARMLALFGRDWFAEYDTPHSAGVTEYGLREIPLPDRLYPRTPDNEVTWGWVDGILAAAKIDPLTGERVADPTKAEVQ